MVEEKAAALLVWTEGRGDGAELLLCALAATRNEGELMTGFAFAEGCTAGTTLARVGVAAVGSGVAAVQDEDDDEIVSMLFFLRTKILGTSMAGEDKGEGEGEGSAVWAASALTKKG